MSLPVEFLLIDALRHLDSFSVPGIGSFYRAYIPAKIQEVEKKVQAPREVIVFTEEISPSGVRALEQFLNRPGNPAVEQAFAAETMGKEIIQVLNVNGKYELKGLGRILLGSAGLEAEWNADVHQAIYSNLFGFKDVLLPAKQSGQAATPAISAPTPVTPIKEVTPVAAVVQPPVLDVPKEPIITPSPAVPVPEVEILPIPKPVEVSPPQPEITPQPPVAEEKPVIPTPEPQVVLVAEDKPKPVVTENTAPAPGPAQKAVDNFRKKEERKKRKFPWAVTLSVLLLVLLVGLWFWIPQNAPKPVASAEVEVPNAEGSNAEGSNAEGSNAEGSKVEGSNAEASKVEGSKVEGSKAEGSKAKGSKAKGSKAKGSKAEDPASPIEEPIEISSPQTGYYLIVASSSKEADVLKEAEYWKSQGLTTEVIPPDTITDFYRLSVLHSTKRGELVAKMIELKDETYSWILKKN